MARLRRRPEDDRTGDGWQITYCSVVMILVAIFMMVISYSTIERKKMSRAVSHLAGKKLQEAPDARKYGTGNPAEDLIESTMAALTKGMGDRGMEENHSLSRTRSGVKLTIAGGFFFSSGAMTIREEAYPVLNTIASVIKDTPFQVGVAAHADVQPSQKVDIPFLWETTALRAGLILRHLADQGGLPLRRLASAGFGPYRPALPGEGNRTTAQNERVEFLFEFPAPPVQGHAG